jgi:cell wall-associated NlpC family hydrolase
MWFSRRQAFPRATLVCCFIIGSLIASNADAQTRHHRRESALVPLQPFSLDEPQAASMPRVQLAYYAPRPIPRAEPVPDNDESETFSQPEARGDRPMVAGNRAVLRGGVAYAPSNAPDDVKAAIWAVNTLRHRPYVWGGGHGSFNDYGYDCSGTVSFALHHARRLNAPLPSGDFVRYGERGRGRWVTVYARRGHTFAMIAGLRLDTTDMRDGSDCGPRWHTDSRDTRGFEARHPVKL